MARQLLLPLRAEPRTSRYGRKVTLAAASVLLVGSGSVMLAT